MGCFQVHHSDGEKLKSKRRRLLWWTIGFIFPRNSKSSMSSSGSSDSSGEHKLPRLQDLRLFSLAELKAATKNFSSSEKLGEGGFGVVYRGQVKSKKTDERIDVAVKRLNVKGQQGQKEWLNEVTYLRMVDHPNLVELLGYCLEHDDRGPQCLLVYELMPNKSLDEHIFQARRPVLPWSHRLQIALGTARGLAYLHEEMKPPIIYRDLKSANILLDNEFKPKLSDFGLARDGPVMGNTHVTTDVVGTAGYAAPEYVQTGHLNAKSDVWTFGMVLLELLTGKKALDMNRPRSERSLADWVKPYGSDSKKFRRVIDPRLRADISMDEAKAVLLLAQKCIAKNPKQRPRMTEVVRKLEEITSAAVTEQNSAEVSEIKSRSHSIASMGDISETELSRSELWGEPHSGTSSGIEMESGKSVETDEAGASGGSREIKNNTATEDKQTEAGTQEDNTSASKNPGSVEDSLDTIAENNETVPGSELYTGQQSYTRSAEAADDLAVEAESVKKKHFVLPQSTVADGDKNDSEVAKSAELISSEFIPEEAEEEEEDEEEARHLDKNAPTERDQFKHDIAKAAPGEENRHHDALIDGDEEMNTTRTEEHHFNDCYAAKAAPEELKHHDALADGEDERNTILSEEDNSQTGDPDTAKAEPLHKSTAFGLEVDTEGGADTSDERTTQQETPVGDEESSQNDAPSASTNDDIVHRDMGEVTAGSDATTVKGAGVAEADHTLVDDSDTLIDA